VRRRSCIRFSQPSARIANPRDVFDILEEALAASAEEQRDAVLQ
jgi:hypothetical protein